MCSERVSKPKMRGKVVRFIGLGCLVLGIVMTEAGGVSAQTTDPLPVVKAFFAAQCAGNLQTAMALVADDAVIVNGRGRTVDPRAFVQGNISVRLCIEIQRARVSGEKVFWTNTVATTFLEALDIASMEVNADAVVRGGKIVANRNYYTPRALARLRPACDTPQGRTIRIFGQLACAEFVQLSERFTESVLAQRKPFSVETDFMSLPGYRQYLLER